jgi:hypothetical protein
MPPVRNDRGLFFYHSQRKELSMNSIREMVKDRKKVRFSFYRDKELWYITEDGFEFPVPLDDVGNATFLHEDKAILFMRYIRKYIEFLDKARKEHDAAYQAMNAGCP